jgi:hypothetical protein
VGVPNSFSSFVVPLLGMGVWTGRIDRLFTSVPFWKKSQRVQ